MTSAGSPAWFGAHRRVVIGGIVTLVVVVALAVTLPLTLGGDDDAPSSPRAAATAWGTAVLFKRSSQIAELSCGGKSGGLGVYGLVLNGTGVHAGKAVPTGAGSWRVPLETVGPLGGTEFAVDVERRGGKYLVC